KAGQRQAIPFEIDCAALQLKAGTHQVEVQLTTKDQLPWTDRRFATFAIREPRRILVLTDYLDRAEVWKRAVEAHRESRFVWDVVKALDAGGYGLGDLRKYQAVFLFNVRQPSAALWDALDAYVQQDGGGLGVVPGGDEFSPEAWGASKVAQRLLPGR